MCVQSLFETEETKVRYLRSGLKKSSPTNKITFYQTNPLGTKKKKSFSLSTNRSILLKTEETEVSLTSAGVVQRAHPAVLHTCSELVIIESLRLEKPSKIL